MRAILNEEEEDGEEKGAVKKEELSAFHGELLAFRTLFRYQISSVPNKDLECGICF